MQNKIKDNAMRIAELVDYKEYLKEQYPRVINTSEFERYDYLMPIFFEAYTSKEYSINIHSWVDKKLQVAKNKDVKFCWDFEEDITEQEFILGLQNIIIKYLELKGE